MTIDNGKTTRQLSIVNSPLSIDKTGGVILDLEQFKTWVHKEFGIDLFAYKSNQLHRRILSLMSRVGAKDIDD